MMSFKNDSQLPGSAKSAEACYRNPEKVTEINDFFTEGYRLFIAKDYESAAEHLVKCNQASVELYGQFAPECFKPHYYYGLCMLEIAQSTIEGQIVPIVDAPIDEDGEVEMVADDNANYKTDDNEAESAIVQKADDEVKAPISDLLTKFAQPVVVEEADSPSKTFKKPTAETNNADESISSSDNSDKVGSTTRDETLKEEEELEDEEEEDENIPAERLAWESLEVARKICEKAEAQADSETAKAEWKERRTEVLSACSECSILIEQYEQALADSTTVLELQKTIFKPHDRRIAQTYFNMGRCHRSADDFEQAAIAFQEAGRQLQNLIDYIRQQGDAATEEEKRTAEELAKMIVEVSAQAQDAVDSAKARAEQLEVQRQIVKDVFHKMADEGAVAAADDITAQIRHRKASSTNKSRATVPTNSVGAASTTDTAGGAMMTTNVHTGTAIEMEEQQAAVKPVSEAGDSATAQGSQAVKRPASATEKVDGAKKAKIVETEKAPKATEAN